MPAGQNEAVLTYNKYWCCTCSLDLLALAVSLTSSASIHPVGAPEDDARTPGGQATFPCRPPAENSSHAPSTSFAMRLKWIAPQPAPPPPRGKGCAPGELCYMGLYDASPANLSGWGNLVFVEHEAEVEEARLLGMHSLVRIDKLLFNKTESGGFKGSLRRDVEEAWALFVPNATRMLASSAIGFNLGGEPTSSESVDMGCAC